MFGQKDSQGEHTRLVNDDEDLEGPKWFEKYVRPCIAEFVGVALFVAVGCMSVQSTSPVAIAIAHGFIITLLVAALGNISGAHVNPAVTLGIALSGGIGPVLAGGYVICQLLGSLVGAGLVKAVLPDQIYNATNAGAHTLNIAADVTVGQGIICEVLLTTVLVLTVLLTAVDTDTISVAPLAIGFAIVADILAGINITGASMNPARSFGPAVVLNNSEFWKYHYVYWVGPAMGAIVAACLYRFLFANPSKRLLFK